MLNQLAGAIKHTPGLFLRASFSTYVVAVEVVDGSLAEHRVVLELTLAERRSVAGNDDELGLARADGLDGALVTKDDGTGLHNKRKARVDRVGGCWKSATMSLCFKNGKGQGRRGGCGLEGIEGGTR